MRDALSGLEALLQKIDPFVLRQNRQNTCQEKLAEWLDSINNEINSIRSNLNALLFDSHNMSNVELVVKSCQITVNQLLTVVQEYKVQLIVDGNPEGERIHQFYNSINSNLDRLLNYLLTNFNQFYDTNLPAAPSFCAMARSELADKLVRIEKDFANTNVNQVLLDIALEPIRTFIEEPGGATYTMVIYIKELANQLLRTNTEDELINKTLRYYEVLMSQLKIINHLEEEINVRLHVSLLHMNYNSHGYINLCISSLWRKLIERIEDAEKITFLRMYKKMMKQIQLKPGLAFLPNNPSTTMVIADWVTEEIDFFNTYNEFSNEFRNADSAGSDSLVAVDVMQKINTTLNRAELITLTKIFMDTGVITYSTPMEILRKVGTYFTTKGSDELNPATLRGRFFNKPNQQTIDSLKDKLIKCLNTLRSW